MALSKVQLRSIVLMSKSVKVLENILASVEQSTATTLRDPNDGEAGWTVLETVCHLLDFESVCRERAERMIAEDNPRFAMWDHDALVSEKAYNAQNLVEVMQALLASRKALQAYFTELPPAAWERTGVHPEYGDYTMTDVVLQIGWHDVNHLEQITRTLNQG
jgi:hypothetical protein